MPDISSVEQSPQLGTGHAVMQARQHLEKFAGDVFVLYADTPLIPQERLVDMLRARASGAAVVVLGFDAQEPGGYGRLVTSADGKLDRIVEKKDATPEELAITLCNSGVMCIDGAILFDLLDCLTNQNASGEYYLTDIVAHARAKGLSCAAVTCDESDVLGANDRNQLAKLEQTYQDRVRLKMMQSGVTLIAPETVFFSHDTQIAPDVTIWPHVVFGPGVRIDSDVTVNSFCHLEGCDVASGAVLGPYARLRPQARIGENARVGNFVEIKKSNLASGVKVNHLTYIGDAQIGKNSNIGAGTITCNYDGYLKHNTLIGEEVFVGSNSALVAPVKLGDGTIIAAGSVITQNVPENALAFGRTRQQNKPGLAARLREHLLKMKKDKRN